MIFGWIRAELDRLWHAQERQEELFSERLQVLKDRCDIIEGRVTAVDYWMRTIGAQVGAGVPVDGGETQVDGFDAESEDFENDDLEDTLTGLEAWQFITGEGDQ